MPTRCRRLPPRQVKGVSHTDTHPTGVCSLKHHRSYYKSGHMLLYRHLPHHIIICILYMIAVTVLASFDSRALGFCFTHPFKLRQKWEKGLQNSKYHFIVCSHLHGNIDKDSAADRCSTFTWSKMTVLTPIPYLPLLLTDVCFFSSASSQSRWGSRSRWIFRSLTHLHSW